ncbi:MAG: hypoxanthine phosphoribosyltransferase [Candidatus Sumerlaeota bacterium]|nr:hypoxanthine phosphoribosyltransferase [Candidatus Sumerlaeota bacterium]
MTDMMSDLEKVLFDGETINQRIAELADEISRDYTDGELVLVTVLRGGLIFLADLSRRISIRHTFDVVGATSYGPHVESSGQVLITKDVEVPLQGRDVLLVEDIYDTGRTLHVVRDLLQVHDPRSLEICSLLVKDRPRSQEIPIKYIGFHIPNVFVVGYGLDYDEQYRHLNCVGVLKKEIYS